MRMSLGCRCEVLLSLSTPGMSFNMSKSHHFGGIGHAEQLMDLAEGRPAFTGRGQKPFKQVLAAIVAIKKCRQGSFLTPSVSKPCSCGWHTKVAARKQARQAAASASSMPIPSASSTPTFCSTTAASTSSPPSPFVHPVTSFSTFSTTTASATTSPSPSVYPITSFSTSTTAAAHPLQ